ncbi:MAG TPA: NUDIX hydrolase [Candidatus Paceibacterota bacterium]|jgi:8-oxo-dGTP pyrophosphatase MutT (NUDIX family)|nr:NUDIX hydrolase [Candidatus Paceibacterota bacterium]
MDKNIHEIQGQILKDMLLRESARFSDLRPKGVSSDQFTFHIKKLVDDGVLNKRGDGSYELTLAGKEYANRFDIDSGPVKLEKQGKLGVLVVAYRDTKTGRQYVMQQRLKHPFYGFHGFITGKIKIGESVIETAQRELEEETGLRGEAQHHTTYHERIYSKSEELLEDKYFFICLIEVVSGTLTEDIEGGKNSWVLQEKFLQGDTFYDIEDLFALIKGRASAFSEKSYTVDKY